MDDLDTWLCFLLDGLWACYLDRSGTQVQRENGAWGEQGASRSRNPTGKGRTKSPERKECTLLVCGGMLCLSVSLCPHSEGVWKPLTVWKQYGQNCKTFIWHGTGQNGDTTPMWLVSRCF